MHEVIILTDEEFYEDQQKKKRKSFLEELEQMSKPTKSSNNSFSIKNVKPEDKKEEKKDTNSVSSYMDKTSGINTSETEWGDFVEDLQEFQLSPIESITDENITGFQLDDDVVDPDDNKYGKVFKKELAMLSEVLKDVKGLGTRVNNELKKMTFGGKGTSSRVTGIPKGYSDLVEACNSINTSKIQIIKAMSDLKTKQMDWALKEKANQGPDSESTDNIADMYYKRIIGGGTKNFIQNSANNYQLSDFDYDPVTDDQSSDIMNGDQDLDPSTIDSLAVSNGFNITQPLRGSKFYQNNDDIVGDEYGYISNEKNDYEMCVYQFGDGQYQFAALDNDGEVVEGVELPSDSNPEILKSLQLRPGSNFIYDQYGRKYRLIEMGPVDTSDVDDMDYPFDDDDNDE